MSGFRNKKNATCFFKDCPMFGWLVTFNLARMIMTCCLQWQSLIYFVRHVPNALTHATYHFMHTCAKDFVTAGFIASRKGGPRAAATSWAFMVAEPDDPWPWARADAWSHGRGTRTRAWSPRSARATTWEDGDGPTCNSPGQCDVGKGVQRQDEWKERGLEMPV